MPYPFDGGEDHILHHRAKPATLNRFWSAHPTDRFIARGRFRIFCRLADQSQDVKRRHAQLQDRRVGLEFAAGQTFEIHVRFKFAVILFDHGVIVIECDDFRRRLRQIRPPGVDVDLRREQMLSFLIDGANRDLEDLERSLVLGLGVFTAIRQDAARIGPTSANPPMLLSSSLPCCKMYRMVHPLG